MASALSLPCASVVARLLLCSLLGQTLAATASGTGAVTIHARLIDWECWNRMRRGEATVDGSDIMVSPQDHKAGCLQAAACKASGYYLAVQCSDGRYAPLYDLTVYSSTSTAVATYVDALTPGTMTDISVTVTGTNNNGNIQDGSITACTGSSSQCDHGTCTGACTSSYTNAYAGWVGCEADDGRRSASLAYRAVNPGFFLFSFFALAVVQGLIASQH